MTLDWLAYAGCRDADDGLFFGPENETAQAKLRRESRAKAFCLGCPVLLPCRRRAQALRPEHGVWGALTADELAAITQDGVAA